MCSLRSFTVVCSVALLTLGLGGCFGKRGRATRSVARAVGVIAAHALAEAAHSPAAQERRRRRRRVRRLRRRHQQPPPISQEPVRPAAPMHGPLNDPGQAPTREQLNHALERMLPALGLCAPEGSGRLIIEADISAEEARVRDFGLYGAAAEHTDPECVEGALAGLEFVPFDGDVEVYWAVLY